ncbi:MAG: FIG003879: Predicted amidohydrolase; Nit, partial [uncultured Solirubrobacteraceae bacterium]
ARGRHPAQLDARPRRQSRRRRLVGPPRGRFRRRPRGAPREVAAAGDARADRRRRRAARRSHREVVRGAGARARNRPGGRLVPRARRILGAQSQHLPALRPGRGDPRPLPQAAHVRLRGGGDYLPRVRLRSARGGSGRLRERLGRGRRARHLLRPALSRALPAAGAWRSPCDHPAVRLHGDHHRRALGRAGACPRDRGLLLRGRRQPVRFARSGIALRRPLDDRRSVGHGAVTGHRRRGLRDRRSRSGRAGRDPGPAAVAGQSPADGLRMAAVGARTSRRDRRRAAVVTVAGRGL